MTAKEFYELNKGKYFMYGDEKVRVVGYNDYNIDAVIVSISISKGTWMTCITAQEFVNRELVSDKDLFRYAFIDELEYIGENLNLCEILKGCEGIELWSDIFGKCKLESLDGGCNYEIEVFVLDTTDGNNRFECFTKYGRLYYCYPKGKCMLWPSETNRDWSTFKKPLKADDWVVVCDGNETGVVIQYGRTNMCWKYAIPFDKFVPGMAEEEMKKLSII